MAAPGLTVQERPRLLRQAMRAERPLVAIVRGAAADAPASAREAQCALRTEPHNARKRTRAAHWHALSLGNSAPSNIVA